MKDMTPKEKSLLLKDLSARLPYGVTSIVRFCNLPTFRDSANASWLKWNGKIKELRIKELREELEYFKIKVAETERLLKAEE